jgi:hypothetical protein
MSDIVVIHIDHPGAVRSERGIQVVRASAEEAAHRTGRQQDDMMMIIWAVSYLS